MIDYNKTKIFKIIDTDCDIVDIGFSTQKLCKYFTKSRFNSKLNKIVLIEYFPCENIEEAKARVQYHLEQEFSNIAKQAEHTSLKLIWTSEIE